MVRRAGFILASLAALLLAGPVLAQGLPGLQGGGAQPTGGGWLSQLYAWIVVQQAALQRELASLLGALKQGESGAWWGLIGGSFLYGMLHAAGPGHGKLVISSYLFANNNQVRSGLLLTLVSSLLQAVSAIVLVGLLAVVLGRARLLVTRDVHLLELVSYGLIVLLGLVMLWRFLRTGRTCAHGHDHDHGHHDHGHHDHGHHDHGHHDHGHHHHHHAEAFAAPPADIPRRDFWAMVFSVGIRPCTGAVIVLLFTFGQGLVGAGLAATFAMALGTALTVGVLALLAVGSRRVGMRLAGEGTRAGRIVSGAAALTGALAVTLLGALLFWATWSAPPSV